MMSLMCFKPQSRATGAHVECEHTLHTVAHLVCPKKRTADYSATSHPKGMCLASSSPARVTDVYLHHYIKKVKLQCIQYCLILSHFRFELLTLQDLRALS